MKINSFGKVHEAGDIDDFILSLGMTITVTLLSYEVFLRIFAFICWRLFGSLQIYRCARVALHQNAVHRQL